MTYDDLLDAANRLLREAEDSIYPSWCRWVLAQEALQATSREYSAHVDAWHQAQDVVYALESAVGD